MEIEPSDPKLDVEIKSQKITLSSEFRKKILKLKNKVMALSGREKKIKKWNSILTPGITPCKFQQHWSKKVTRC